MEVEKKVEWQRRVKEVENNNEDSTQHKVLFAAGTALLMACLKGAVMASFAAQWRWWVFVVLNLVLLAIVFTSMGSTPSAQNQERKNVNVDERKKKSRKQCNWAEAADEDCLEKFKLCKKRIGYEVEVESLGVEKNGEELPNLSKEELNERVEAFIAMFRKQLVTDAEK